MTHIKTAALLLCIVYFTSLIMHHSSCS